MLSAALSFGRVPVAQLTKAAALSFGLYARALEDAAHPDVIALTTRYDDTSLDRFVRLWHLGWAAYRDREGSWDADVARAAAHFALACDALDEVIGEGAAWRLAREVIVAQHRAELGPVSRSAEPLRSAA